MNKNYFLTLAFLAVFSFDSFAADTTPPVITLKGGNTQNVQINSVWSLDEPLSITDDQTPSQDIVTSFTWSSEGPVNPMIRKKYTLVIKATDLAGNFSEETIIYNVDDLIPPVIHLNTPDTVCVKFRTPYNSIGASVTDNFYNSNQVSLIKKQSNVNTNIKGTYTEVFEAVDGSGNVTVKTRVVIVQENCNTLSIDGSFETKLNLYPNPANDYLEVSGMEFNAGASVSLVSIDGKTIEGLLLINNILDVSSVQAGLYSLTIIDGDKIYKAKVNIIH